MPHREPARGERIAHRTCSCIRADYVAPFTKGNKNVVNKEAIDKTLGT